MASRLFAEADKLKELWVLAVVVTVFFVSSLVLVFGMPQMFVSPDETANWFFANEVVDQVRLYVYEPANLIYNDMLYPRSVVSVAGRLVPISFLGLPVLYGLIGKAVGSGAMFYLTPLIATLAVLAWYGVIRRLFSPRIGLLAGVLLAVHPAWWYYTARTMMHNVLFVSFLIFALWWLVTRPLAERFGKKEGDWVHALDYVLAGIMFGAAVFTRTSELFWLLPSALVVVIFFARHIKWTRLGLVVVSAILLLTPLFFINKSLYGGAFTFGYTVSATTEEVEEPSQISRTGEVTVLNEEPFPYEIHEFAIVENSFNYGFKLFWWMSLLGLLGAPILFLCKNENLATNRVRHRFTFMAAFAVAAAFLGVVYGSWIFHDNPDPNSVTIANSYVRYWLPLFVMSTVFGAAAIDWLASKMKTNLARVWLSAAIVFLVTALGVNGTFFAPDDGLISIRQVLQESNEIKTRVLELTEEDAIIIVDRADKIFWPDRLVRYPLRDEATYHLMPKIVLRQQLYYYGITFPETDIEYLNNRKLAEFGLKIDLIQTFEEESLYQITQAL